MAPGARLRVAGSCITMPIAANDNRRHPDQRQNTVPPHEPRLDGLTLTYVVLFAAGCCLLFLGNIGGVR